LINSGIAWLLLSQRSEEKTSYSCIHIS
jgi:hypothetical protein